MHGSVTLVRLLHQPRPKLLLVLTKDIKEEQGVLVCEPGQRWLPLSPVLIASSEVWARHSVRVNEELSGFPVVKVLEEDCSLFPPGLCATSIVEKMKHYKFCTEKVQMQLPLLQCCDGHDGQVGHRAQLA